MLNNTNKREPNKLQRDEIILPTYKDLFKKFFSYINEIDCLPQYIVYMLRDLAYAIMTSYPSVQE